jgi:phage FluMu protein Com
MALTFKCEHCHKKISAPETVGGKRGKCPFCKQRTYIPMPVSEDEILDLAPLDETEEQEHQKLVDELRAQERDLIANTGGGEPVPLSERDDLSSEDLHHFVINYCIDMADGNLERAAMHAAELKKFYKLGMEAVKYFQIVQGDEPALSKIPPPVVQGFLTDLVDRLQ